MSELGMDKLHDRIEELEQQNAELVAHIEDSKHVMMVVASCDTKEAANVIADKWIEQTPKQSLAKHDAEVIFNAIEVLPQWNNDDVEVVIKVDDLIDYANQLREQGK